jgi:hypothetical protein
MMHSALTETGADFFSGAQEVIAMSANVRIILSRIAAFLRQEGQIRRALLDLQARDVLL